MLNHPVLASFVRWKWQAIWLPYWSNLLLNLCFAMVMTSYICSKYYNGYAVDNKFHLVGITLLWMIILREILQIVSDWNTPITTKLLVNVHEYVMIALSGIILSCKFGEWESRYEDIIEKRR